MPKPLHCRDLRTAKRSSRLQYLGVLYELKSTCGRIPLACALAMARGPIVSSGAFAQRAMQSNTGVVGGKLLVMALGSPAGSEHYVFSETNYVFDRQTGKLLFACRRKPR